MKGPREGYVLSAFKFKGKVYAIQAKLAHLKTFDYIAFSGKRTLERLMKPKRISYRRKNPRWCNFAVGLCWSWANKDDRWCHGCEYNKEEVK